LLSHKKIKAHNFKAYVIEFGNVPYLDLINSNAIENPQASRDISENTNGTTTNGSKINCDIKVQAVTPY